MRLDRDARLDVQLQRLAAGQDGVEALQHVPVGAIACAPPRARRRRSPGGRVRPATGLHEQHVPVERGQVDQRAVERIALRPGGPRLLPPLELLHRAGRAAGRGRGALAGAAGARGRSAAPRSRRRPARRTAPPPRPRPRRTSWSAASRQAASEVSDAGIASTAARCSRAASSRASRRARPTCPCAGRGGPRGGVGIDAVAPAAPSAIASARRRAQRDEPAPRADGHRDVVRVQSTARRAGTRCARAVLRSP